MLHGDAPSGGVYDLFTVQGLLGGSWVVISRGISPLIWVLIIVPYL